MSIKNAQPGLPFAQRKCVLIMDDESCSGELLRAVLRQEDVIHTAFSAEEGIAKAREVMPELVLLDLKMCRGDPLPVLRRLKHIHDRANVVVLGDLAGTDAANQVLQAGAADFIPKPIDPQRLRECVQKFLTAPASPEAGSKLNGHLIGRSPSMLHVLGQVQKFARSDITILLQGETGTGKELFARLIHDMSRRRPGPFVPIDCTAIPETLLESELFGHVRGAFTGATEKRLGRFEQAHGGTVFLDEVANIPAHLQPKLLRTLQNHEVHPLGSSQSRCLDVRLVAATNASLEEAVRHGCFREDLFYRLSAVKILLPPLREREGDIDLLAEHLIQLANERFGCHVSGLSEPARAVLRAYPWPGNVRELKNVIESALLLAEGRIEPEHLPHCLFSHALLVSAQGQAESGEDIRLRFEVAFKLGNNFDFKSSLARTEQEIGDQLIAAILRRKAWNKSQLAQFLRVDPKTLRTRLKRLQTDSSAVPKLAAIASSH